MVQTVFKWKCIFFSLIILCNVFVKSIYIDTKNSETPVVNKLREEDKLTAGEEAVNATHDAFFNRTIRPGQTIQSYALDITVNGDSFDGRAVLAVQLNLATREDDIVLQIDGLDIKSVKTGVFSAANVFDADFNVHDQELHISPAIPASLFIVIIEYSGQLSNGGLGLHLGRYNGNTYVAMNLHPTYARRVFPCMDEPTEISAMSFKFNNLDYTHLVANSQLEENSANQFRPLMGPPHLWGMIAHSFVNINIPIANVLLYGREDISNQDAIASLAINSFYTNLNEWTNKQYTEIVLNQDGRMNIVALPDVSTDWNALSTVAIWEPYVFMEPRHAVKQRSTALPKLAEAMAKQWFGYVIYPQNWRYEWIVSGLASYAGWETMRRFQGVGFLRSQLDINTLFVTEVIQESLLRDSYSRSGVLEPEEDLFDEDAIRDHIGVNGILKYKAPALMRMMRIVLGDADTDYIQLAARALVNSGLGSVNSLNFIDAVNSEWLLNNNGMLSDFEQFLEPWIKTNGYPLLNVLQINRNLVLVVQERFGFSNKPNVWYQVPLTYTTSRERNFGAENLYPEAMLDASGVSLLLIHLDENWIIFNIQGQGYYRVNYGLELWDRIIKALEKPDTRAQIHPLNRATLVDDALNIARTGRLDYDIAFRLVLTMEHETEYAPWKAFVRNMDFLRKRLEAYVDDNEDLDKDIYLRMVQKTIRAFEENIGFYPGVLTFESAMQTLTRGLVMDHACRAKYQPCITAAKKWFYNPSNNEEVNPNIPHEIRPAVYCTMAREGEENIIEALNARLEIEPTLYERLVILESLACSQDEAFINGLLQETIAADSPYSVEERVKIFAAVAGSSYANANLAFNFMRMRTSQIRKMYGGPQKLEEVIFILADNMAGEDESHLFSIWVESMNSYLDDSQIAAERALDQISQHLLWDANFKNYVYRWIAENAL